MQKEAIFLWVFGFVIAISILMALLLLVKKVAKRRNPNYIDPKVIEKFKKQEKEAKEKVTNGITQVATAQSLVSINEGMLNVHHGLNFFDMHNLSFGTMQVQEIRETIHKVSAQKVKRLYNFYQK